jgi:hypothetical protein
VLGDLVVPERAEDAVIEVDGVYDTPSSVPEQLEWLRAAGFSAEATSVRPDLAVFLASAPPGDAATLPGREHQAMEGRKVPR